MTAPTSEGRTSLGGHLETRASAWLYSPSLSLYSSQSVSGRSVPDAAPGGKSPLSQVTSLVGEEGEAGYAAVCHIPHISSLSCHIML